MLGYKTTQKAIRDHCKGAELLKQNESLPLTSSPRGITIIPERDLYRLVLNSKLPQTEAFEEWEVATVLPAIIGLSLFYKKNSPLNTLQVML